MTNDEYDNEAADERIRAFVDAHYNPPRGAVPREAMWAAVRDARRAERAGVVAIDATRRAPLRVIRPVPHWRWGAALAAGLLLGIALDRALVGGSSSLAPARTIASRAAGATVTPPAGKPDARVASADMSPSGPTHPEATTRDEPRAPRQAAPIAAPPAAPLAAHELASAGTPSTLSPAPLDARALYRGAATQTLVQAEVLLTAYRRGQPADQDQETLRQTARWSREVLSSTRLLLDSPAGRDPQLHQLLTDLELVLAQIVQLSGAPLPAGERALIDRAMHERDLIPRLRSAVPAGALTT